MRRRDERALSYLFCLDVSIPGAGIHIYLHAHRYFDNSRCGPFHFSSPGEAEDRCVDDTEILQPAATLLTRLMQVDRITELQRTEPPPVRRHSKKTDRASSRKRIIVWIALAIPRPNSIPRRIATSREV
jgi:hypothetical protein